MQSGAPERKPSVPLEDKDARSTKRRRTSDHSIKTDPERPESSNAPSTERRTLTYLSPQMLASSSREEDMTPPESANSIKYTRTGRVSKATKGQRVHHCDECGKIYTRAEHLRRHQQNHKPGAFPCDVPGCGRSFYREDLLTRHKARHNDPLNPPSRQQSPESHTSVPDHRMPRRSFSPPSNPLRSSSVAVREQVIDAPSVPITTSAQSADNTRTPKGYLDINRLENPVLPLPINTSGTIDHGGLAVGGFPFDPSPPYSPGYDSPTHDASYSNGLPYYQPHPARVRNSSIASSMPYFSTTHATRSPVSAGSSSMYMTQWSTCLQDPALQTLSTPSGSEGSYGGSSTTFNGAPSNQPIFTSSLGFSCGIVPEERDTMEENELMVPNESICRSPNILGVDDTTYTSEESYLDAYWLWLHPLFPILHRSTFKFQAANPLLRAAILALGGQALGDQTDRTNTKSLHEQCLKVLKKRTINDWHTFRVCDMQAILLVEIYAIYKSRRPPLRLSLPFEHVYQELAGDPEALRTVNATAVQTTRPGYDGHYGEYSDITVNSVEAGCKRRLLLACYILDQQHALMFGRQRNDYIITNAGISSGMQLPFPESQSAWDAPVDHLAPVSVESDRIWQAFDAATASDERSQQPFDAFQSMLLLACSTEQSNDLESLDSSFTDSNEVPALLQATEQLPSIKLAYHTFMMCKHTPVRDLLAVAGESWIMAEKLNNASEYVASQITSRDWIQGSSMGVTQANADTDIQNAIKHALCVLKLYCDHPKTGLLFQEWSIYLAAVVIWARAYVNSDEPRRTAKGSIPIAPEPRASPQEVDEAVSAVLTAGPTGTISVTEAKMVLLWTKAKIEKVDVPHNSGLTNDALDVLGKLISRGNDDGWFGS